MDEFCIEHPSNVDRCSRHARLVRVDEASPRYNESEYTVCIRRFPKTLICGYLVYGLFAKGWKHPEKPLPPLQAIYKIISPETNVTPFLKYQWVFPSDESEICLTPQVRSTVMTTFWWSPFIRAGSEALLFHGTTRACLLGETAEDVMLCKLPHCSLCSIIRQSFDIQLCGNKNKFMRCVSMCIPAKSIV